MAGRLFDLGQKIPEQGRYGVAAEAHIVAFACVNAQRPRIPIKQKMLMQEWIRPRIGLGCKKTLTQARRLLRRERLYHVDMPRSIVDMDADPIALFLDELEMGALLQVRPILHIELDLARTLA